MSRHSSLHSLLLVLVGLGAGLLAVELLLRVIGFSCPDFYRTDYYLGVCLRPGARGWFTSEGKAYIRINSQGFRDQEHEKAKAAGVFRVAVIGDSFAEALDVPIEDTFWTVMQRQLAGCRALPAKKVEVLNFGVSGYGTGQELIMLRRRVWDYSPDVVVLAFTIGNDIRNNSRVLEPEKLRPFFQLRDHELIIDNSFRQMTHFKLSQSWFWAAWEKALDWSRTLQLIREVKSELRLRGTRSKMRATVAGLGLDSVNVGLDTVVYRPPSDPDWIAAWSITDALLLEIAREVQQRGAKFLVATIGNPEQVNPDELPRQILEKSFRVSDLFYPDRHVETVGHRGAFAVLDLGEPFQAYAVKNHLYLHGFANTKLGTGHWNVDGNRLAGLLIAQAVCQLAGAPVGQ